MESFNNQIPLDDQSEENRLKIRHLAQTSTYFMGKAVIGFRDMTPHLHKEMCEWIDNGSTHKHGIVPRDHLKSSVWTIANTVKRIVSNPNIRILIGNETSTNASHFLMRIEKIWERNALFQWLFPELIPDFTRWSRWNATEMVVPRDADYPEATIEVIGVGGAVVSRHYNLIKLDDLVGKAASESGDVMKGTIDWYQYCESLLEDPNRDEIHNVGTPWGFADLDAWVRKHESDYIDIFFRSCYNSEGEPIWPERFDRIALERIRKKYGAFKFSCQYLCKPVDPESGSLDERDLRFYQWRNGSIAAKVIGPTPLIDPAKLHVTMRIDPAISEKPGAARSAIVVDGVYKDGRVFLLEAWAKRCQPFEMLEKVFELFTKWQPVVVGFEAVAYQRILQPLIEKMADERGIFLNVLPMRPDSNTKKENRIRGALQPVAARGLIWVHEDMEEFIQEWRTFPNGETVDLLDAFAFGPHVWEEQLDDDEQTIESDEELTEKDRELGRSGLTGY